MNFDTAIIGGGLAGLVSGIKLTKKGKRCVIISSGHSALHFFSGSFDLLSYKQDGTEVEDILSAYDELAEEHPYKVLGKENFKKYSIETIEFLKDVGIKVKGEINSNHYRISPIGIYRPTWLSVEEFFSQKIGDKVPYNKVSIVSIEGFLDYQPEFVAEFFKTQGVESSVFHFSIPELDLIRKNPTEFRSTNIARVLDENIDKVSKQILDKNIDADILIMPACIGLKDLSIIDNLSNKIGKKIFLMPTLPPSMIGMQLQTYLVKYFRSLGGVYMLGDTAEKVEIKDNVLTALYTQSHEDMPILAKDYILCSGSFFSKGLIASRDKVQESVIGVDVDFLENRSDWYNSNIFEKQNYEKFGVKFSKNFNALKENKIINNLYVSGAILSGFNPIKEGSGSGVSILTSLAVSDEILKNSK